MSAKTDHFHTQHQSLGENDFTRTRWWWVRHAPVRSSGGRIYGQSDIDCDTGDAFAYDALARILPRGAVWLTSHLQRTTLTADAIWRSPHWDEPSRATQIRAFAEQDLGVWQGMDRASFMKGRVAEPGSYWFGPAEEKPEGGESFVDLVDRVRPAIAEQTRAHAGRDIVAVAHGGSIRAAIAVALNLSPQAVLAFGIENCALTRLDHYKGANGEGWRVVMINHQPWSAGHGSIHLQQPSGPETRGPAPDETLGVQA